MNKNHLLQHMEQALRDKTPVYPDTLRAECPQTGCGNDLGRFPWCERVEVATVFCQKCKTNWYVTINPSVSALGGHVRTHILEWEVLPCQ